MRMIEVSPTFMPTLERIDPDLQAQRLQEPMTIEIISGDMDVTVQTASFRRLVLTDVNPEDAEWTDAELKSDLERASGKLLEKGRQAWREHQQGKTEPFPT